MMRRMAVMILWMTVCAKLCAAQGFVRGSDGFAWQDGENRVRVTYEGEVLMEPLRGGSLSCDLAFWYGDADGYARQSNGRVTGARVSDGTLVMEGRFVARGALPVRWELEARAEHGGVSIRHTLTATEPIDLREGVFLRVPFSQYGLQGNRFAILPGTVARVPSMTRGFGERILLELNADAAAKVELGAPGVWHTRPGKSGGSLYALLFDGLSVDEPRTSELRLTFEDMPERLPGEITPQSETLAIPSVGVSGKSERYGLIELSVPLRGTWKNPFDPEEVRLDATFTAPSGRSWSVPGFYMVPYDWHSSGEGEVPVQAGEPDWRVRFTPDEAGTWQYELTAVDATGARAAASGVIEVAESGNVGFVRVARHDPRRFMLDDGARWFPIGHNLPQYEPAGPSMPSRVLPMMAARGENYNRWWMASYTGLGLEWGHAPLVYLQDAAARMDRVLQLGEAHGIRFLISLDTHQDFQDDESWDNWHAHPYNVRRGGPCILPSDFFTNAEARALYKNRLRYIVARWGYSQAVLGWELVNELEGFAGSDTDQLAWHKEMGAHLKEIDPYDHLVTTSFWSKTGDADYWKLPEMDILQTHFYPKKNAGVVGDILQFSREQRGFDKPHLIAEFGLRDREGRLEQDAEAWALHNGIWAGTLAGCAGSPMTWWHDGYVEKHARYTHREFEALSRFISALPESKAVWEPFEGRVELDLATLTHYSQDKVELKPTFHWGRPEVSGFVVGGGVEVNDVKKLPRLLQGRAHADLRNAPVFDLAFAKPGGRFEVDVKRVSNGALLRIWVDENLALEERLPAGEGLGEESRYDAKYDVWETTYNRTLGVDVGSGRHRIRVENDEGADWLWVNSYRFENIVWTEQPVLVAPGLRVGDAAAAWVHDLAGTWHRHAEGVPLPLVENARLVLKGLSDGPRVVEWWDIRASDNWAERDRAVVITTGTTTVVDGRVDLAMPDFRNDIAVQLRP